MGSRKVSPHRSDKSDTQERVLLQSPYGKIAESTSGIVILTLHESMNRESLVAVSQSIEGQGFDSCTQRARPWLNVE